MLKSSKSMQVVCHQRCVPWSSTNVKVNQKWSKNLYPYRVQVRFLVRVAASPINPSDWALLQGLYGIEKELPIVPGFECSGTVVAAGSGLLPRLWLGCRVTCIAPSDGDGTWAEYMVSKANSCKQLNKSVDLDEGVMTIVNPMSAWAILNISRGEGHKALANNAAAIALGQMLMRLGQRFNYPMVHIVNRQEQVDLLRDQGAVNVLNSSEPDFDGRMQEVFHHLGVTIAFDAIAGEMTARLLTALPDGGKVVVYGGLSQAASMANLLDIIFHNKQVDDDMAGMTRGKVLIVPGLMEKNARSNLQKTV